MRFAIASEHLDFYRKHQHIEFDELLTPAEIEPLKQAVEELLSKRLKKLPETRNPRELFMAGRNGWQDNPVIQKVTQNHKLAEIAANLFNQKSLRLAYDQLLCTRVIPGVVFTTPHTLQEISCFQPILGGLIIRLSSDLHIPTFFPKNPGSGVFFSADFLLALPTFFQTPNQTFLLIAYAPEKSVYVLEKNDLHTHALKREGYVFGDLLRTPLVYK